MTIKRVKSIFASYGYDIRSCGDCVVVTNLANKHFASYYMEWFPSYRAAYIHYYSNNLFN